MDGLLEREFEAAIEVQGVQKTLRTPQRRGENTDFTQASGTVSHKFLNSAMGEHGTPPKCQRLAQMIYQNAPARIKGSNGTQSEPLDVQRGILQGDILSPIMSVLVLNSAWAGALQPPQFPRHSTQTLWTTRSAICRSSVNYSKSTSAILLVSPRPFA